MADEVQDAAPVDDTAPVDDEPTNEPEVQETKFNKTQLQQISSIMGDMLKKQLSKTIETDVLPLVSRRDPSPVDPTLPDNPAVKQFNERLSEMIYAGDIVGALSEFQKVQERANQNLSKQQQNDLNKAISQYEDKPHYKDVHPQFDKLAKELVAKGYPAGPAAELAYEKSLNSFIMGNAQDNSGSLSMLSGGRRTVAQTTGKLPPQFEKAYQQGKQKGLFTDRKDYVNSLDPRVVAQYDLKA